MKRNRSILASACLIGLLAASAPGPADAHDGRRLSVEVANGKLQAQGVNTGADDGAPAVRPYLNSIHHHWRNVDSLGLATANLPGFDIPPSSSFALAGQRLELELLGVSRWVNPPPMRDAGVIPRFEPLGSGLTISIQGPAGMVDSDSLGTLTLSDDVPFGGQADLDLSYSINALPSGEIHVLEFILSATPESGVPEAIEPSDTVFILLSPDGSTPHERLHHASLFLEGYLATAPEPNDLGLACALSLVGFHRRRGWYSTGLRAI